MEFQNIQMGRRTYEDLFFFFHKTMFYIAIMQSDNKVVSIGALFFKKAALFFKIAIHGQKALHWRLSKVILLGMYNCNFEETN